MAIYFFLLAPIRAWRVSFFFSSRRRHTRWPRDWSSDVCSSDLAQDAGTHRRYTMTCLTLGSAVRVDRLDPAEAGGTGSVHGTARAIDAHGRLVVRSEERRVGKGGRRGGAAGEERDARR